MATKGQVKFCPLLFVLTMGLLNGIITQSFGQETNHTVKDIDGNVYHTVVIGEQEWIIENLKVTRYNDGTPIRNLTDVTGWRNENAPGYVWFDNDISNKDTYGALYNGYAVSNEKQLAPEGWHVATDNDWKELEMYLGMSQEETNGTVWRGTNQGGKLKEAGTIHWQEPNEGATNESGLTIIPGGRRDSSGRFYDMGTGCTVWTSTGTSISCAYYRHFSSTKAAIGRNPKGDKKFGFAVRCIKDK